MNTEPIPRVPSTPQTPSRRTHGGGSRGALLIALSVLPWGAWASGCGAPAPAVAEDAGPEAACTPTCGERACGDDGCGGVCGTCEAGSVCSWEGACVPLEAPVDDCSKSCAEQGFVCGDHCGTSCGVCPAGEVCADHACVCAPRCSAATCEGPDGCGGTCGPCAQAVSCPDCPLKLQVVGQEEADGAVRAVTVALDYAPADGAPAPSIADLQLLVTWPDALGDGADGGVAAGDVALTRVATGPAIQEAHKELYVDPTTGKPYRELETGDDPASGRRFAFLVLSTEGDEPIPAGRWLILTFRLGPAFGAAKAPPGPYTFALVEREQTFAPPTADQTLWGQPLGSPVVVWTDALGGPHVR